MSPRLTQPIIDMCLAESATVTLTRSDARVKAYGEVFTPTELVLEILGQMESSVWEEGKTFLDPTCGNGQMLAPAAIIKRELGHRDPLGSIYGVDILLDNVLETRQRLLAIAGDTERNRAWVKAHIVCADALKFDFEFDQPDMSKFPLEPLVDEQAFHDLFDAD